MNIAHQEIDSLVEQYYTPLLCFVRSRIHSTTDAEDIVQETWMRSLNAIAAGAVQNIRAYLHRVARNLIVDHLRSGLRQAPTEDSVFLSIQDNRVNPEKDVLHREEIRRVEFAIMNMSERSRQVFLLARVEGLSYAKIGRKLGISRQTVYEHMTHAIVVLESSLRAN